MKFFSFAFLALSIMSLPYETLMSQTKITIPLKIYPGYNFRTGLVLKGKLIVDSGQFIFEKYKYKQYKIWQFPLEDNIIEKFIRNSKTGKLKSLKNKFLNVLAAIDADNQLKLIVDLNFDNNFLNDTMLLYRYINYTKNDEIEKGIKNLPYTKLVYYTNNGKKNINYFQLQPLTFYKKNIEGSTYLEENKLDVFLYNMQYYGGDFSIKNNSYSIKSFTTKAAIKFTDNEDFLQVYITNNKYKNTDSQYASLAPLKLGDTIELNNKLFKLNYNQTAFALTLSYAGIPGASGVFVGRIAPDIQGLNEDSSLISLYSLTDNYVLMDFGFEGCGYCIEALPKLNALSKSYEKQNLKIFSIVGTRSQKSFKNYLKKYSILNAVSVYDSKWRTKEGLSDRYKIGYFPTYILLNKDKVICMREYGLDGLIKIEKYFTRLFNN